MNFETTIKIDDQTIFKFHSGGNIETFFTESVLLREKSNNLSEKELNELQRQAFLEIAKIPAYLLDVFTNENIADFKQIVNNYQSFQDPNLNQSDNQ